MSKRLSFDQSTTIVLGTLKTYIQPGLPVSDTSRLMEVLTNAQVSAFRVQIHEVVRNAGFTIPMERVRIHAASTVKELASTLSEGSLPGDPGNEDPG